MKLVSEPQGKVVLYFPILWMPQWPMWAPMSLYAIATALMHAGYEVELIDERVDPEPREALERELSGALFVAISGKSGAQCRNMESTAAFVKGEHPDVPVVAGGWFPSLFPEQTITSENIDIIIVGPADFAVVEVADRLREGRTMHGLERVYFRQDGEIVKNPVGHLPRIEETHPIPWSTVGIQRYLHPHGWINYFTSRGCPGGCTFCSIYCLDPKRWTALPPERVIEDMEALIALGARAFQIVDTDFCADQGRVEQICRSILERGLQVRFHVLGRYQNIQRMTDERVRLLRLAGCTEIEVGLETGSQRVSDQINKGVDVEEFPAMIRRFVAAGIRMRVNVMLGFPDETREDLAATFRVMLRIRELGDAVRFQMFRFTPIPDSALGKQVWSMKIRGNAGRVPSTYEELLDFPINDEPTDMFWISRRHERDVMRAYRFYAPLLFYKDALDTPPGRPWWRPVLKLFQRLAVWRVARGVYLAPFEIWLNRLVGKRMPFGADNAIPLPDDKLPVPEMGQSLTDLPPLPP